jgi:transposase
MQRIQFTAFDVHAHMTNVCVKPLASSKPRRWEVPTSIPSLRKVLEQIPRPIHLTFEEGPMAGWLYRNLRDCVDELLVNDPRRNGLVVNDGDATDDIDAEKLCDLYRGGFLRQVHHPEDERRAVFKELVSLYHKQVASRVKQANRVIGHVKQWGCVWREKDFADDLRRDELVGKLGQTDCGSLRRVQLNLLWDNYDTAVRSEMALYREMVKAVKQDEFAVRLMELPGIAEVRAATWVAYLDTPWRFKSKQALWKYLGIGLTRSQSGRTCDFVHVEQYCNHLLRGMILGAAQSAITKGDNPFRNQYDRWLKTGLTFHQARRNAARSMAAVGWGMWKNGGVYDPKRVGENP